MSSGVVLRLSACPNFAGFAIRSAARRPAHREWDPASHGAPEERIAGIEATLFGESVGGIDDLTTLLPPRLASVAETAWNGRAPRWEDHRARLARHGRLWRERGLAYLASTEIPWT
ncbi:family 20 glycosylhydrolase [Streptomyces taklimakanensis]|uniref:family 20 glycosylhydrolase n=1 Tax=Streptomyces taklimakanensis TaxID=2569853 RepID=UPI00192E6A25|nr:family 20 glycosylhydrolase [Streptomyces taklimakanensis]